MSTDAAVKRCREWADCARKRGYQPLPSDPTPASEGGRKKPLCRFADYWEAPAPDDLFDRFPTTNIQVMTGRYWNLCVLDFDGKDAVEHAAKHWPRLPRTWVSFHSNKGKDSRHLWFSLPRGLGERRKTVLWEDTTQEHTAIELLCDRSLVVAPPSIHIKTGNIYGWQAGCTPLSPGLFRPAMLPMWVWHLPVVSNLASAPYRAVRNSPPSEIRLSGVGHVSRQEVLNAVGNKAALARQWGLRFAGGGSGGWLYCHDIDREDANPSAQFCEETGTFWTPTRKLSFLDLAVELGVYATWRDALYGLARDFGLTPFETTRNDRPVSHHSETG